jgi:hypothetical protein
MKTIYTAIIGPYDTLKEPAVVTPGWKYICFTDQDLTSNIWEIRKIKCYFQGSRRFSARSIKILFHKHVDTLDSMWIDGSFLINCNLDDWWNEHFQKEMTCINHPIRNCIYAEAKACINLKRGDPVDILKQVNAYTNEIPEANGLIQSGILMRRMTPDVINLCEKWHEEVKIYSERDQISFAKAVIGHDIHYINWNYQTGQEFIYTKHNIKS